MSSPKGESQSTDYVGAKSRTASIESGSSAKSVSLAPLSGDRSIAVSSSPKRQHKDRRIYVNKRTGLPVRPPTSFGLFKHALRRSIKNDKVSFAEFNKLASDRWAKMSESTKSQYGQRAKELADQYKKIEVRYLRKKLRQLQRQVKDYSSYRRR